MFFLHSYIALFTLENAHILHVCVYVYSMLHINTCEVVCTKVEVACDAKDNSRMETLSCEDYIVYMYMDIHHWLFFPEKCH